MIIVVCLYLRAHRGHRIADVRFLAGEERSSRASKFVLNRSCERIRATEHAPRDPFRLLERRHGLEEIIECGAGSSLSASA